jgi:ParB family chromosome partitioning protein
MKKEAGLGRGLSELLLRSDDILPSTDQGDGKVTLLSIKDIVQNASQPRKHFDEEMLLNLANSIAQKGIISPIIVRKTHAGKFEIIAGERRFRAAQLARLENVPVIIKEADDTLALELSIIENIQRQDLSVIEEAHGYQMLAEKYSYSQSDIAAKVGKSRSHVANIMRLLTLPEKVKMLISTGKLSTGHAKILIGKDNAEQLAEEMASSGLSVRQAEGLTKKVTAREDSGTTEETQEHDEEIELLATMLSDKLRLKVGIDSHQKQITIRYKTLEELDTLLQLLSR